MYKKTMIAVSLAASIVAMSATAEEGGSWIDDFEISGELKNESAFFTRSGATIGDETVSYNHDGTGKVKTVTNPHDSRSIMKSETSVRLFINGPLGENAELDAELRPVYDGQGIKNYEGHESYTQQDFLRELYVDTAAGEEDEVSLRIGKQQVVWGTADGMKLLDIINPTDYREMAQNSMDESRIPVWMVNAEMDLESGANIQGVISQPKENLFAGLNRNIDTSERYNNTVGSSPVNISANAHDKGHAFVMMGPDTITGGSNGFLNIAPDLGTIASQFAMGFAGTSKTQGNSLESLYIYSAFKVGSVGGGAMNFADMTMGGMNALMAGSNGGGTITALAKNFQSSILTVQGMLTGTGFDGETNAASITGAQMLEYGFASQYDTNLANYEATSGDDSTFEYMDNATFKTFDTLVNARSQYQYDMPSDSDLNLGFRLKNSTDSGVNYSANYSYNYDQNPIIDLSWHNSSGDLLTTSYEANGAGANTTTSIILSDSAGTIYRAGMASPTAASGNSTSTDYPVLRFTQKVKRAHNIGGSFDMSVDTESLGAVVLRGEALYQKDVYSPVIDKAKLSIGDMTGALEMVKGDRFKYVLGADITVLKNMMVSGQFIQDRNLDYVNETSTPDANNSNVSGQRYTADYATMHMSNGFQKAEKNKEFYSLFMSKPFGAEQQHRWNNIFMYEENGGKWNRFDVEYSFSDELIGSVEYDKYWGNVNTQFGQLKNSSNVQLGLKYIF